MALLPAMPELISNTKRVTVDRAQQEVIMEAIPLTALPK